MPTTRPRQASLACDSPGSAIWNRLMSRSFRPLRLQARLFVGLDLIAEAAEISQRDELLGDLAPRALIAALEALERPGDLALGPRRPPAHVAIERADTSVIMRHT